MHDVLTEVLNLLRLRTTLYALTQLTGDWGVAFPRGDLAYFHVVSGADAWLSVDGEEPQELQAGDALLLAHGSAHKLTSASHAPVRTVFDPDTWSANRRSTAEPAARPVDASGQSMTGLVCGAVVLQNPTTNPLIGALPTVVHLPAVSPRRDGLDAILQLIDREGAAAGPARRSCSLASETSSSSKSCGHGWPSNRKARAAG